MQLVIKAFRLPFCSLCSSCPLFLSVIDDDPDDYMDTASKKILESATVTTLHAQHFSRSSAQAHQLLTDLLSRYLVVLSSTCKKYAEHAGRLKVTE